MLRNRWLSIFLLLSLVLSGCSGRTEIKDECLVGRWMVLNDNDLAQAMLPPQSFNFEDMRFQRALGAVGYQFNQEGTVTFLAVQWQAHFDVLVDRILMPLILSVSGTATASVTVSGDRITVGEISQDVTSMVASLDNEEMMNSSRVSEFAPLFIPQAQTGQYQCEGDSLSITYSDTAGMAHTLNFTRVIVDTE